jgi:hypothetical protein
MRCYEKELIANSMFRRLRVAQDKTSRLKNRQTLPVCRRVRVSNYLTTSSLCKPSLHVRYFHNLLSLNTAISKPAPNSQYSIWMECLKQS